MDYLLSLWPILLFVGALAALIKTADIFVDAAEDLGHKLHWPHFVVGVLIVGLGTSLPELASSLAAAWQGTTEMVVANVVGSNIANICLAFGIASLLTVVKSRFHPKAINLVFLVAITALLILLARDGVIDLFDSIVLLLMLGVFIVLTFKGNGHHNDEVSGTRKPMEQIVGTLIGSGIMIAICGDLTVRGLSGTAQLLNINPDIAAMALLAIGTSLPEILVSVMATMRGNTQLALGNVMGSNAINTLAVVGMPALLTPLAVADTTLAIGLPFLALSTIVFITCGYIAKPWWRHLEAAVLLMIFAVFMLILFNFNTL